MGTDDFASVSSNIIDPDMRKFLQEGSSHKSKYDEDLQNASNVSYKVKMMLAYSSEKLANLENLLLHILSEEDDIGSIDISNDSNLSPEFIEKAFTFDLLYAILDLELKEVDVSMCALHDMIFNVLREISENSAELLNGLLHKLKDLKQSQDRVLEMKIQLAKLQINSAILRHNGLLVSQSSLTHAFFDGKQDLVMDVKEEFLLQNKERKPDIQAVEHRYVLRMLEKSLSRELELEKKLMEAKQNEEDLKLKNYLLEQVSVSMEEAAQVAWSRFLEADNTVAILTGISNDMLKKFHISPFDFRNASTKEEEISTQLKDCVEKLKAKESLVQELNSSITQLTIVKADEVTRLREKVQILEKNLEITETRLKESYSFNEMLQRQIKEMDAEIETLRDNLHDAEIRAASLEEKVTHLTDSNMELTEEIDFLEDMNNKNVSMLEKQLRELDVRFQHARASSETSLEQQNMLNTAIWDMENLIAELKQKVAKAEANCESVEGKNAMLAERNEELEKELGFVRAKVEMMEDSLNRVDLERTANAKDISLKIALIMDTVTQLRSERERVQIQVIHLMKENKSLRGKLHLVKRNSSTILEDNTIYDENQRENIICD